MLTLWAGCIESVDSNTPAHPNQRAEPARSQIAKEPPSRKDKTVSSEYRYTNRLIHESSPYLLQHAHNPVDWYPWCPEALERARKEDKPIFLSIGYSACHWCHVMEKESFENPEIAKITNEHFVCIKVDREERPDLDDIYMKAVVIMNEGQGGWPMSVWLTPELKPIYAGTYFPPKDRFGRPGFKRVLLAIAEAWRKDRKGLRRNADEIAEYMQRLSHAASGRAELSAGLVDQGARRLIELLDWTNGGFGSAPKFPQPIDLALLLRYWNRTGEKEALKAVTLTLDKMARGGIYDQIGGGFHRYSVDAHWLVPHFEKMLYDNALLTNIYLEGYQATGNEFYARVAAETLDYLLRDMRDQAGGFHSSQDADSEGEEGKFYLWTAEELRGILGDEAGALMCRFWGVTDHGNFEGKNILHARLSEEEFAKANNLNRSEFCRRLEAARQKLFEVRASRVRPGKDDKILASWNALAVSAFARGYQVLGDVRYLEAAQEAARFVLTSMRQPDGRLFRTYRQGHKPQLNAYLDDYAFMLVALIDLYEADFNPYWIRQARSLKVALKEQFWDNKNGGFYFIARDHERLILRSKVANDGSIPSGNAMAALGLLRLADLTGDSEAAELARRTMKWLAPTLAEGRASSSQMLCAIDYFLTPRQELALIGPANDPALKQVLTVVRRQFQPYRVVAHCEDPQVPEDVARLIPLLAGKSSLDGRPRFFLCRNFSCQAPETDAEKFIAALNLR